jgi:hypothetical protein
MFEMAGNLKHWKSLHNISRKSKFIAHLRPTNSSVLLLRKAESVLSSFAIASPCDCSINTWKIASGIALMIVQFVNFAAVAQDNTSKACIVMA